MAAGPDDEVDFADIFGDYNSADEEEPTSTKRPAEQAPERSTGSGDGAKRPRRGKGGTGAAGSDPTRFFELEAEEAGDGSGEEEDADDLDGFIDNTGEASKGKKFKLQSEMQRAANAELDEVRAEMEARGPETGARRVFGGSFLDAMQDKYEKLDKAAQEHPQHKPMKATDFSRLPKEATNTRIVPAPQDPKLWRCKSFADERQLCISLMLKASDFMAKGKPVNVFSIFYSQHQRGYIYVEAFREAEVREFCKGIRGISPWSIIVVPQAQMPQVFDSAVTDAEHGKSLQVGDFVRYKRGPYTGDLAQIEEINDEEYIIRLKPRIAYKLEMGRKADDKETKQARKRPIARWFNKHDLEASGVMVTAVTKGTSKGNRLFYAVDDEIYRDGFLFKTTKVTALDHGDQVRPQEHELQDWRLAPAITDDTRPKPADQRRTEDEKKIMPPPVFIPMKEVAPVELVEGDIVIVNSGELQNLRGRVIKAIFMSKTVTVRPFDVGVSQDLELAVSTLSKYFEVGDYVKVIGGARHGEVGYVMKLIFPTVKWRKDSSAVVLNSDLTAEFEVPLDKLRLTAERSEAVYFMDDFKLGDLVALPGRMDARGVLTRIESTGSGVGIAEVLLPSSERIRVKLSEVAALKKRTGKAEALFAIDRLGTKLRPGCIVKAPRSQQLAAPIRCEILYIHGDTVFLEALENLSGERKYLACNSRRTEFIYDGREVMLMGKGRGRGRGRGRGGDGKTPEKEGGAPEPQYSPHGTLLTEAQGVLGSGIQMASETKFLSEEQKQMMMGIDPHRTKLVDNGYPVRIVAGSYKGLRAVVRADLGEKVRLLLMCKAKLVEVPLSYVKVDDYANNPARTKRRQKDGTAVPGTPILKDFHKDFDFNSAPPAPALGAAEAPEDAPLTEENSWDPNFLAPKEKKVDDKDEAEPQKDTASQNADGPLLPLRDGTDGNEEPAHAATSSTAPAPASPALSAASSRRRKRQSVLPGSENQEPAGEKSWGSQAWDKPWEKESRKDSSKSSSSWWQEAETKDVVDVDMQEEAPMLDPQSERSGQLAESPLTVGFSTPGAASVGSTAWTPQGSVAGVTPTTPWPRDMVRTPMPLAGEETPVLKGDAGEETPVLKGDAGARQAGLEEEVVPMSLSETPMLAGDTPTLSKKEEADGEETPFTALTGDDLARGGETTPMTPIPSAVLGAKIEERSSVKHDL